MQVDVWTDIVCPWCYIGVTRFERALERFGEPVDVRIHPFQLDPDAPIPGVPAEQRYKQKFGSDAPAMLERVTAEASKEGLDMRFDRALTANTFDAHRLLAFASERGKERVLESLLYRAYFTDGLDVSDRSVLASLAAQAGLDRDEAAAYLESDGGVEDVVRELSIPHERGISGVPAFVFEDEFIVPGAVDTNTFIRILEQMRAMSAPDA